MKTCTSCLKEKPKNNFGKYSKLPDGLNIYCLECTREKSRQWRAANHEKYLEQSRKQYNKDIEKTRAYKREEAKRNREQRKQYAAKRRSENYEKVINIERASRERNREKNRPAKNARQQIRNRIVQGKTYSISDKDLRKLYNQPCSFCGTKENLSIDHIIPLSRGGSHTVGNMMTLCRPCNSSKGNKTVVEWKKFKMMYNKHITEKGSG